MTHRFIASIAFILTLGSLHAASIEYWDWKSIDTNAISFPKNFLFGVGTSAYQVEGGNKNVWDRWAHEGKCEQAAGQACDHWNRYHEDAQLIQNLGANAYRFGVEWSRIEPQQGVFDEAALDHYAAMCDELLKRGIAPVITLHHYNDPIWFADVGGFEKEENIQLYVRFAKKVIDKLHNKVHLWLTFNSPTSYAAKGYLANRMPPGKKNMQLMAEVMKNLLVAHVRLYKAVKHDRITAHAQVGTLHNICQLEPARMWDKPFALLGDYISHRCLYNFFKTGVFRFYIPCMGYVYHKEPDAPKSLDFIGLNYYSHFMMHGPKTSTFPDEMQTMCPDKTIYPEGFYRAIKEIDAHIAKPLNVPIYVTENGVAPVKEEDRELFLRRYYYAMHKAMNEGCDVRGYFYWSLMDNYEWGTMGKKRYGLYHVDFETHKRTLKSSAQYYIDIAQKFGNKFQMV